MKKIPASGEVIVEGIEDAGIWETVKGIRKESLIEPKGKGWKTRAEIEELWKLRASQAGRRLRELVEMGYAECFSGKTRMPQSGLVRPCTWYRIIKSPPGLRK